MKEHIVFPIRERKWRIEEEYKEKTIKREADEEEKPKIKKQKIGEEQLKKNGGEEEKAKRKKQKRKRRIMEI